jgi:excisionase family DNA binding protein
LPHEKRRLTVTGMDQLDEPQHSVSEAARIARVSDRTMRRWLRKRMIRHVRIGGRIRVPDSALQQYLAKCDVPATS